MYTVTIPQNILIKDPHTGEPVKLPNGSQAPAFTFKHWCVEIVLDDQRMGSTPSKLARALKLIETVTKLGPGGKWHLEDQDYEAIKVIVESPQKNFGGTVIATQLLPFSTAILEATATKEGTKK